MTPPANTTASTNASTSGSTNAARKGRSQNTTLLTREEAAAKAPGNLKLPEKAMAYLSEHQYVPEGSPLTLHTIAFILFQIAAASHSATDSDGIKAVAFLLEEIDVHGIAMTLADRITTKIENKIEDVAQAMIDAKDKEIKYFRDAGISQQNALVAVRNEVGRAANQVVQGREGLEGAQNGIENMIGEAAEFFKTSLNKISEQVEAITSAETYNAATSLDRLPVNPSTTPLQTTTFSYAQITGQHLPSTHATNITRNSDKRRQFTIQAASRDDNMGLDKLTELEILTKLKLAYETMTVEKDSAPKDLRFTSVRRMKKGGILFDINTDEAADWLRAGETQKDFTKHFSASAIVQGYQFRVLAEFVPISFNAESLNAATTIEEANGLSAGSIAEVGWVKRADRRTATQQVAHLKIAFAKIGQANDAIERGLSIQGKGVNIRQMIVEPQRCAKCQLYGHDNNRGAPHFAKNCAWIHDVCGLCGEKHRTSDCRASMPSQAQCANCKVSGRDPRGHSVHSRTCPTFLDIKGRHDSRNGTQQYRFFVTEDTKTWETNRSANNQNRPPLSYQEDQHHPTPPPNQRQRPEYARPPPGPQGPPKQHPKIHVRGNDAGPRGVRLSSTNRIPLGQSNLSRFLAVQNAPTEDDEIDKEIEASNGLLDIALLNIAPQTSGAEQEARTPIPESRLSWDEETANDSQTQNSNTNPTRNNSRHNTPTPTLSNASSLFHYDSSPIHFPSSPPPATMETESK